MTLYKLCLSLHNQNNKQMEEFIEKALEKYFNGDRLTEQEMAFIVPFWKNFSKLTQYGDKIKMEWNDPENGAGEVFFTQSEIENYYNNEI